MINESLLQFVKENYPKKAYEIGEAVDMLVSEIDEVIDMINNSITVNSKERKYDEVRMHIEKAKNIEQIKNELINLNNRIKQDFNNDAIAPAVQDEIKDSSGTARVTSAGDTFTVDDNPTGLSPYQLIISGKTIKVFDWRDLYVKSCEYFAGLDPERFSRYIDSPKMNGKYKAYFSRKIDRNMVYPRKLKSADLYIETAIGTKKYLNLIKEMLIDYGIPLSEYEIIVHRR